MDWLLLFSTIGTVVIAILTAFVAYLNYRTRPLLIRTIEKHSEDLMEILDMWRKQLDSEFWPFGIPASHSSRCQLPLPVEGHILFPDLENHMPGYFSNLMTRWDDFKKACDVWDDGRSNLHSRIMNDAMTDLKTESNKPCDMIAFLVYEDAMMLAEDKEQRRLGQKIKIEQREDSDNNTFWNGYYASACIVERSTEQQVNTIIEYLHNVLENLSNTDTRQWEYVNEARGLYEMEKSIGEQRRGILHDIDELFAFPILPGNCKFIKEVTGGFFPLTIRPILKISNKVKKSK